MWKYKIVDSVNIDLIEEIYLKIKSLVFSLSGFVIFLKDGNFGSLIIELPKENVIKFKNTFKQQLIENLLKYFKTLYFKENLLFEFSNEIDEIVFYQILLYFDYEYDYQMFSRFNYFKTNEFLINSFEKFCLNDIKQSWDDIIKLLITNVNKIVFSSVFYEFLKYLIKHNLPKVDFVYIYKMKDRFVFCDESGEKISDVMVDVYDDLKIAYVAGVLISLSPLNVVTCFEGEEKLRKYIYKIFD